MNKNKISGLVIWNAILSATVFMLVVGLWATQEDMKTLAKKNSVLLEPLAQIVETDENMLTAIESNTQAIKSLIDSDEATLEAVKGLIYIIEIYREDHVESIAEIYQGHIVPIRAILMNNNLNWP